MVIIIIAITIIIIKIVHNIYLVLSDKCKNMYTDSLHYPAYTTRV